MKTDTLLISTLGLDTRTRKAFELFFQSTCKGQFQLTDEHDKAIVTLLDMDTIDGESLLLHFRENHPEKPIIVLSIISRNLTQPNCFLSRKPINHMEFKSLLESITASSSRKKDKKLTEVPKTNAADHIENEVINQPTKTNNDSASNKGFDNRNTAKAARALDKTNEHHFVGNHEDIDINNTREVLSVAYSPELMFQGAVHKGYRLAKHHKCAVEVIAFGLGVVIDPKNYKAYTATNESILRPLCLLETHDKPIFKKLPDNFLEQDLYTFKIKKEAKLKPWDIDAFLWKVTLWSSRGRIPKDVNIKTPVYLKAWPNLTRFESIPHGIRIAALMQQGPARLTDIAKRLNIPQRYVFSFFAAAKTLNLAYMSREQVDTIFAPETTNAEQPPRSVLGKLLGRLSHRQAESIGHKKAV